jgi:hypothetical protein
MESVDCSIVFYYLPALVVNEERETDKYYKNQVLIEKEILSQYKALTS